jgi:hypothetical protein
MYALARNAWKYQTRDKRKTRRQKIEFEALAPDTAEEILRALELLEIWVAQAHLRRTAAGHGPATESQLAAIGRRLLRDAADQVAELEVCGEAMENSSRKVVIQKAPQGYHAYRQMLHYYAVTNLLEYWRGQPDGTFESLIQTLVGEPPRQWVNLGGQLIPEADVDQLRTDIRTGRLGSWCEIHQRYDELWQAYPQQKQRHALATLSALLGQPRLTRQLWNAAVEEAVRIQQYVGEQVYQTRRKDYDAPFRQITFRSRAEMQAVLGTAEENSFVRQVRAATEAYEQLAALALGNSTIRVQPEPTADR